MNSDRFSQLQEVFHRVLEQPPAERNAYVREVCGDDDAMRAELISLLAAHRDDDEFLESTILGEAPLREGERIGVYRVRSEIGRGGMGVVYLAEDTRLKRPVALKALSPRLLSDTRQQERFRREAVVAGSLSHPSIATIYALEEVAGRFYIVSEYVPGKPLGAEGDGAPLAYDRIVAIALQVSDALAAAHEKGIVHRDLKPENILRVDEDTVKIVDFGLAVGPGPDFSDQRLTVTGTLVGTPAYMSPEQLCGEIVDFRSDIFSFGIVLYELAIGRHPFGGETLLTTAARILESPPGEMKRLRAESPALSGIIERCLEKAPDDRFPATRDLVRELQNLKASEPSPASRVIPVGKESVSEQSELRGDWWVVHQIAVLALYTVMIILLFAANPDRTSPVLLACAFVSLASGVGNGAMRVHLLFTSRFNRKSIGKEVRRMVPLLRGVDLCFSLALLAAALAKLPESQPWAAALGAVAVSYAVVTLVVEPATIRSVFSGPPEIS